MPLILFILYGAIGLYAALTLALNDDFDGRKFSFRRLIVRTLLWPAKIPAAYRIIKKVRF